MLIGVSCGHRVPRIAVRQEGRGQGARRLQPRNVYWCQTCRQYRMSGGKATGLNGHAYLIQLRELVEQAEVAVSDPGTPHGRAVIVALGAAIAT